MNEHIKYPRLYTPHSLNKGEQITLERDHAHYLKTVLRLNTGNHVRVFNAQNGEWVADIDDLGKKTAHITPTTQIRTPQEPTAPVHLIFTPIKKHRMDFLIEKAVELGVTDLHPILTARTQMRKINAERIQAQIIEAAEQCERLDIPALHDLTAMDKKVTGWTETQTISCALERDESANDINITHEGNAYLIGPEGGFDENERNFLLNSLKINAVSLGERILRAETAALYCLSLTNAKNTQG